MTVHRNRFLVNKTSRCTEFQFYWYYDSTCFGQPFCPSSGVLSLTSAVVHFMQLWWPFVTMNRMELLQFHPTPGSKRSQLHKMYQSRCTAKNSWWWAERLPETCRVIIPIKLVFGASVVLFTRNSLPHLKVPAPVPNLSQINPVRSLPARCIVRTFNPQHPAGLGAPCGRKRIPQIKNPSVLTLFVIYIPTPQEGFNDVS